MQGGAGHFGDILLGDRKVYPDAPCFLEAGLAGKPEDGMGHPPLHFLVGQLADERLGLLQALAHGLHRVDR